MAGLPIVHFDFPTDDPERSRKFYSELFGWSVQEFMPGYWGVETGGDLDGGMMTRKGPQQGFAYYVGVDDIDAYGRKLEELGGTLHMPRQAVPGMGWWAIGMDPDKNVVGLWQHDESAA